MISLIAAAAISSGLPDISNLNEVHRKPTITYLDRSGALLGLRGGQYAAPVDVAALPAYVPAAFVSIEDRRFYEHSGFDAIGIARALATDLAHGRIVEGASTITQQLARNLFLTQDQTLERKGQEVMLAVMLEQRYSKREILGLYLSRVYFGAGAYGLEAASRRYFDKPAARLTVAEAAVLAGILKSPTNYNPIDQPERSAERTRLVLAAMADTGAITGAQKRQALLHPAVAHRTTPALSAQFFLDWVDASTRQIAGPLKDDLVVETTLDLPLQALATAAVDTQVAKEKRRGVEEAALVSLDSEGRVRALVGGVNYAQSQFDRAINAHRQAGSAWKPFVYLAAMEAGRTPDTPVVDEPLTISGWSPHNYESGYLGPITLQTALAHSVNTVAARLADDVGRDAVVRVAHRLGVQSPINTDPAMALGTTLVTPLEMAQAYAPFSNGGRRATAYGIERIRTKVGRVIYQRRAERAAQVIDNPPLAEMDQMLRGVIQTGTGVKAAISGYDLAGKTGTTSDYRDAWFCGFTGGLTTVVWEGKDDNTSMQGVTGGSAPAVLWRTYMAAALPRVGAGPIASGPAAPLLTNPFVSGPPSPAAPDTSSEPAAAQTPAPPRDAVDDLLTPSASPTR